MTVWSSEAMFCCTDPEEERCCKVSCITCTWPLLFVIYCFGGCVEGMTGLNPFRREFIMKVQYKTIADANDTLIKRFNEGKIQETKDSLVQRLEINDTGSTIEGSAPAAAIEGVASAPPQYEAVAAVSDPRPVVVVAKSAEGSLSAPLQKFEVTFRLIRAQDMTTATLPVGDPNKQTIFNLKTAALLILGVTDSTSEISTIYKGSRLDESTTVAAANISSGDTITLLPL